MTAGGAAPAGADRGSSEQHREAVLRFGVAVCALCAMGWAGLQAVLRGAEAPLLLGIPLAYPAAVGATLVLRPKALALAHCVGVLLLPAVLAVEFGGFMESGGVVLWGLVSPISDLVLHPADARGHVAWFVAFISALVVAVAFDAAGQRGFSDVDPPRAESLVYFVATAVGVSTLVFSMLAASIQRENRTRNVIWGLVCSIMPSAVVSELLQEREHSFDHHRRPSNAGSDSSFSGRLERRGSIGTWVDQATKLNGASVDGNFIRTRMGVHARVHPRVTVALSDLVHFSAMCSVSTPLQVLTFLDDAFGVIDENANAYGVTKVRTIGDGYLAVCGILEGFGIKADAKAHCLRAALFALKSVHDVSQLEMPTGGRAGLRVGLATGSVLSGVVGIDRPQFDIVGEVANMAARLESTALKDTVQVTDATWEGIETTHPGVLTAERRTGVAIKHMGTTDTYLLRVEANLGAAQGRVWLGSGKEQDEDTGKELDGETSGEGLDGLIGQISSGLQLQRNMSFHLGARTILPVSHSPQGVTRADPDVEGGSWTTH